METVKTDPINLVTPLNAETICKLFGNPSFTLPSRKTRTKTGGTLEARVRIPFAGYWLTGAVWGSAPLIDAVKGEVEQVYEFSFSRDFTPIEDDADVAAATEIAKSKIMQRFDAWLCDVEAATEKALTSATSTASTNRIVRRRKAKQSELPAVGSQTHDKK